MADVESAGRRAECRQNSWSRVRVRLKRDGNAGAPPLVLTSGRGSLFKSARDSASARVFVVPALHMLQAEHYETWKDIEITFDPRDMFRG